MEFPRLVYQSQSMYMLVEDAKAHAAAMLDGWFHSVPEALAKKHDERPDMSVTVYKEQGGKMESFKASTQEEADMFIQADGWHATAAAATAAAVRAEWPASPADVDAKMGALATMKKADVFAFAARIGVATDPDAKVPGVLAAIEARLKEPA